MIGRLFSRTSREDELFAEAQALIDDGLDLEFVLALYPEDADWLAPLLDTGLVIGESFAAEEPSYYFEASLKNRFIDAGMEKAARAHVPVAEPVAVVPEAAPARGFHGFQGLMAGTAVATVLGGLSVLTLGVVTAGDSVPGDWNYAFKIAGERIEYSLSSESERTDFQLRQALVRIEEFQKLQEQGKVTADTIREVRKELAEVEELRRDKELDPVQTAKVSTISESASAVLTTERERQPEFAPEIDPALSIAASLGGALTPIDEPEPTATTETPSPTPTVETPTAEPSETAEPTETPEPTASSEPEPTDDPTLPVPTAPPAQGEEPTEPPDDADPVDEVPIGPEQP